VNVETRIGIEVVILLTFVVHGGQLGEELFIVEPGSYFSCETFFLGFYDFSITKLKLKLHLFYLRFEFGFVVIVLLSVVSAVNAASVFVVITITIVISSVILLHLSF
jgi:hypothetical protein